MSQGNHPIEVEDLVVGYGKKRVLTGASVKLPEGRTTVLLGRNAAGKTTLLRTLMGLLAPQRGRSSVLGLDPMTQRNALCEQVGFVPDRPDVFPQMRLGEAASMLALHHPRWEHPRFDAMVARFGLDRTQRFGEFSKGQGMKAMIALALAIDPEVLLMDEPFGGLDPVARDEVLDEMLGALGERQRTVLVSTHETEIAARIGDHLVVLAAGRLGPVQDMETVLHAPSGPRGADALGALLAAGVEGDVA